MSAHGRPRDASTDRARGRPTAQCAADRRIVAREVAVGSHHVYAFDPVTKKVGADVLGGRTVEDWRLSRDGARLVAMDTTEHITITDLSTHTDRSVPLDTKGFTPQTVGWSDDGLFVVGLRDGSYTLLEGTPAGEWRSARVSADAWMASPMLSPDGKSIALTEQRYAPSTATFTFTE